MVRIYFLLDKNGYIDGGYSDRPTGNENEVSAEVEKDHEVLRNFEIFKYSDGKIIKDEERQRQIIAEEEARRNKPSVTDVLMMELLAFKGAYSSVPCQNHTDYSSVIENFLKGEDIE